MTLPFDEGIFQQLSSDLNDPDKKFVSVIIQELFTSDTTDKAIRAIMCGIKRAARRKGFNPIIQRDLTEHTIVEFHRGING